MLNLAHLRIAAILAAALSLSACDADQEPDVDATDEGPDALGEAASALCLTWEDSPGSADASAPAPEYFPAPTSDAEYGTLECNSYSVQFSGADSAFVSVLGADLPTTQSSCEATYINWKYQYGGSPYWATATTGSQYGVWNCGTGYCACTLRKDFDPSGSSTGIFIEARAWDGSDKKGIYFESL